MTDADLANHLRGKFIAFDGGEGCGKTTQIGLLRDRLASIGLGVMAVRDPGTTRIGELIRAILLNPDHNEMGMRCEMLLYMAARAQMMHEVIRPALDAGQVVLTDRFVSSTLSYQLGGDGLTAEDILKTANVALNHRLPDLTIILDMPAEQSINRVRAKFERRKETLFGTELQVMKDRIEQRPLDYHQQVRANFLSQAVAHPERYRVVDAARPVNEVCSDVWSALVSSNVVHIDFARVDLNEKVTVNVPIELTGEAVGALEGGVLQQVLREIQVECVIVKIPSSIVFSVGSVRLNDVVRVRDLILPQGVSALAGPDEVVATCQLHDERPHDKVTGQRVSDRRT